MTPRFLTSALVLACVAGCSSAPSPDTHTTQQANTVDRGIIIAVRTVGASTPDILGSMTGGANAGATGDTTAYEYIVRKPNHDLVSVAQQDRTPFVVGENVLIVIGTQAHIVADAATSPPAKPGTAPRT